MCTRAILVAAALAISMSAHAAAEPLGRDVQALLLLRCAKCHGKVNPQSGLNVLDHGYLIAKKYVTPNNLDKSELWTRVSSTDSDIAMPPKNPLPKPEQDLLRRWIEGGAEPFGDAPLAQRPLVRTAEQYAAVEADLRKHPSEDRTDLRYFSIAHLHNNPTVSDADLRMFRAALSKLANSLSWESRIVVPQAIDAQQTVFRVNLAEIGWDRARLWNKILTYYPYGLTYDSSSDETLRSSAGFGYAETGSRIPILRADWFVATAAVPPLYHELLRLPEGPAADRKLEQELGVDVVRDFQKNRLLRAGFVKSNVSEHNRLVDRHPAKYGAYWKSYDFKSSAGRQNLLQNPLGPAFDENEFARAAFAHDGGEIIFHLPNGLQGYLLVDAAGKRIDKGPIDVVFDSKQPLGNKEVINGVSCMACHVVGMQPLNDDLRSGHAVTGAVAAKLLRLAPPQNELDDAVAGDGRKFLDALERATAQFLKVGDDKQKPIERFAEPVSAIARQYSQELRFEDVLAELSHERPEALKVLFADQAYRSFGLGVLVEGKVIKRESWEKLHPYSNFQEVADQLKLGTPERVFK